MHTIPGLFEVNKIILWVYEGTCFGHVMFKAYQYITNDNKDLLQ